MPAGEGLCASGRLAEAPPLLPTVWLSGAALAGAAVLAAVLLLVVVFGAAFGLAVVAGLSADEQPDRHPIRPRSRTNNVKLFRIQRLLLSPNKIWVIIQHVRAWMRNYLPERDQPPFPA